MSNNEMTEETAEIQATRFLCHLFQCPRIAKMIVKQWMVQYAPAPVHTGAPRPKYDTPGHWVGAMVARTLLSPTGLDMHGYYNVTRSIDNIHGAPQYVLSAWTPVNDATFSIPLTLFDGHPDLVAENMSRLALYLNPKQHWNARVEGAAMHSHTYYGAFKHVGLMKALYFAPLFALEVLHWYVRKMVRHIPPDMQADACLFILEMIQPLKDYDRAQVSDKNQQTILDHCYSMLLDRATSRHLVACYEGLCHMRQVIQEYVAALYLEKKATLDRTMHPLNAPTLLTLPETEEQRLALLKMIQ